VKPLCFDCLSEDVAVRWVDDAGFEHWLCASDWAEWQQAREKLMDVLAGAVARLDATAP
jgi:hypothetical protein